jgi:hypothetical protein
MPKGIILPMDPALLGDLGDDVPASWGYPAALAWTAIRKWVEMNREAIDELARGACKPGLGYVMGPDGSCDDSVNSHGSLTRWLATPSRRQVVSVYDRFHPSGVE